MFFFAHKGSWGLQGNDFCGTNRFTLFLAAGIVPNYLRLFNVVDEN